MPLSAHCLKRMQMQLHRADQLRRVTRPEFDDSGIDSLSDLSGMSGSVTRCSLTRKLSAAQFKIRREAKWGSARS